MKLLYVVRDPIPHTSTVGICKIMYVEGEICIARRTMEWRLQFLSLTFGNPNRATRGGALESTKNATIDNGERLNDYIEVRDELI